MIQAEFRICSIDDKPIDRSPYYKMVRRLLGKRVADRLTYEQIYPPDDDG